MVLPTSGQGQALNELSRMIKISRGGIGMDSDPYLIDDGAWLRVDLWLDGTGTFQGEPGGRDLGEHEPLTLYLPAQFPFQHPEVRVPHRRFAGLPHVLWGRYICLYASANDWDPSEGMWGFIDRLLAWYIRAARGLLSDPGMPWHPPVTYGQGTGGVLVICADLPGEHDRNSAAWTGWAVIVPMGKNRFELRQWVPAMTPKGSTVDQLHKYMAAVNRNEKKPLFAVPIVALPESLGFEYPTTVGALTRALTDHGIDVANCESLLQQADAVNTDLTASYVGSADIPPLALLIGSPAADRSVVPGRIAHLAAWRIPDTSTTPVSDTTTLDWMKVYDQRPQSTIRRDTTRPVQWMRDRKILILGCGALGAPIAEHCIRAGARFLTLIDKGTVNPGILMRQPYGYPDIGRSKARALSERLSTIAPHITIKGKHGDALAIISDELALSSADLIIDATADRSVAAKTERLRWASSRSFPPILSVMVGYRSEHGLATLALPASTGAGADILRRFAVSAGSDPDLADVLDDFYPDPPRGDMFQPEPGCSDPTYIGSAADLAVLAAQLLNGALIVLDERSAVAGGVHRPTRSAVVVRVPTGLQPQAAGTRLDWGNDVVRNDEINRYQVRFDPATLADIRSEVLRADAINARNETGGVLLGQVDSGCRVVWVSEALGLPPGSQASPGGLRLNVRHLRGELAARRRSSRGLISFIGAWHTHPGGPAIPSQEDWDTMDSLVNGEQETLPQALLVVIGGTGGRWQQWIGGSCRPDMHVEMFFPAHQ